jgi:SAM-dependent methyltransferase
MTTGFWDQRYASDSLIYGPTANDFLIATLQSRRLPKGGKALDIGAGEGRNALYLASLGLDVVAVDQSSVGMQKAARLATERDLPLRTQAADLADFEAGAASLDVVSSIFVHLPRELRAVVHARVASWLRPGGVFILEAYAPEQITRGTGGPKDPALLAPLDVIVSELAGLTIEHGARLTRVVKEGEFHTGEAEVVQVVASQRA